MPAALTSVVLAGGGTAGHVSPLLAAADALRRRHPDCQIAVLGSQGGLEEDLVPARGYDLTVIPKVAFPRRPDLAAARFPGAFRSAVARTRRLLDDAGAQVVVGFGGHVSTPAYLAARARHTPFVLHEQNARAGLANKLGARLTPYVATTFSVTSLPHAQVIGLPLRPEITGLDRAAERAAAREFWGLDADRPTVLVTGGSLGAQRLNETMQAAQPALAAAGVQVLHLTGRGKEFEPAQTGVPYVVRPYAERMDLAYAAADLAVTRAGAGMVCETGAVGLPAVFVPLPIGNGEQRLNAQDAVDAGAAVIVDNADFTPAWVERELLPLVTSPQRLAAMAAASSGQGHAGAADALVDLIERAAH
ncbi:UDP-N-acetylglucosamine--N-acetylmuramyl-(pentapeptide) pyrophosphoryl-undecaprenol N-acetylglucosamine transferase [Calidifontibacter sp. DB0510]|uniref:UDP-N-acetylglucosamine--N-acetylmuramyl-(pentapeptide) pyrophosphoryl-undecaprenol N-acetylglucosamine transferase n=1 Tax=Metallococcus carri TaxID=1656884 RepID=A0A967B106_9MICO|nr:UDP-N-acetylglucosamine--N-acetylmuramyl-(pentapeptide) pyrophosphoryl-undecaprenol N-acetylglucosamine transferase [Metallococcus carri]NHN56034.1 UDP-N-acetylglucosamine--N-acetylmuramyl-(pentapeptide) pyrophosphoryl-undecaprenol N-acetylglucosamine transferase [Metallococcus carri]NOP37509.1 UDP-N-acetylglucosamine--N-acetylmuramyl-(pentapeptide) pyrophosphoryl-undecaprenol N-acetylglucosamine transferase [Calidifontibacter sp. DB2511S]